MIHLPRKSLTELDSIQRSYYNHFALLKEQAAPIVRKGGFIASDEIQRIADANGETIGNLKKKIRRLAVAGYVKRYKHGIVLTSKRTIYKKLNLHYMKKGKEHTPFIKLENMSSVYHIELLRLFFLMKQIRSRYLFQKNGRSNRKITATAPDYFELSLDKICQRGKYNSKMTVKRMVDDLVTVNLIKRITGLKNNTKVAHYDCNKYLIMNKSINSINWNLLDQPKEINFKKLFKSLPLAGKAKSRRIKSLHKPRVKKAKVEYSQIERKFIWFLETGCQDILVENGNLSRHYKSFGSKRGRRVRKSMFPRLLTEILNDVELRKIFLTVFKPSDLLVLNGEGIFYNTNLSVPRYRAFNTFKFDHVELSDDGTGNYDQYSDVVLKSKQSANNQMFLNTLSMNKRFNRITSI